MRIYYAQNREDLFIKGFFPDIESGFYIDVGANDPVIDSVTKIFYDGGWSGINIEPIKRHIATLNRERQRDVNLQVGLSNEEGELSFTEYPEGDGLSTFDKSMKESYKKKGESFPTKAVREYKVEVKTLSSVIEEQQPTHIHFIKIDVEGYEYEVITGYDWKLIRPELICIEVSHINKNWLPVLEKNKYELVFFDGVNNYYLAKESLHRKVFFNYPDIAFSGNPVYYPSFMEIIEQHEKEIEPRIQLLVDRIQDQEQQIMFLQKQQRDVRFLAKRLRAELQLRLNKRAKGARQTPGLTYASDPAIKEAVAHPKDSAKQLLAFIHERDKKNIVRSRKITTSAIKPFLWKVVARAFALISLMAKRVMA